ncbi:hypothetical protein TD95_003798 [Thielaviopsis punctulata]|uniref:RWD domain-containing protein n=1 Tax=Thielaviopsis punctulata TaxID=72032 RepID=A0A0F4ZET3_9PEZI|nr:hypothetical protein TD95_003798 [Thielaviopsis punctulata]
MGLEEQAEEREVLDSIFPEEITVVSDTEYRILVSLDMPVDNAEEDDNATSLFLNVRYPEDYPDTEPILDLLTVPGVPPHKYFSVADDRDQLLEGLKDVMQENLGMAMVFTLYSWIKEEAEQLALSRKQAVDKEREEALLAAEREENKKFQGEPVTPESFAKWREGFLKEMQEEKERAEEERLAELKKLKVKEEKKLTGKQLWEKGLAGKGDEDEEDDGPVDKMAKMQVAA